jgi:hypothetical protein
MGTDPHSQSGPSSRKSMATGKGKGIGVVFIQTCRRPGLTMRVRWLAGKAGKIVRDDASSLGRGKLSMHGGDSAASG